MSEKINNLVNENTKSKNHNPEYIKGSGILGSPINTSYDVEYKGKKFKVFVDTDVSSENRSFGQINNIKEIKETSRGTKLRNTNIHKTDKGFVEYINQNHKTNFNDPFEAKINSFNETKKNVSLEKYNNAKNNSNAIPSASEEALQDLADQDSEFFGGVLPNTSSETVDTAQVIEDQNKDEGPTNTRKSLSVTGKDEIISLTYPVDMRRDNSQDHIVIEQFTYNAPQADLFEKGVFNAGSTLTKGLQRGSNLKDYIGVVKMPIPNQLAISNSVGWGGETANALNAGAFFAANDAAQNAVGKISEGDLAGAATGLVGDAFKSAGSIFNEVKSGNNASASLLLSSFLAQRTLSKLAGIDVNPQAFIARGTGNVVNPNLELLFNGPKLRNFSFSFQFAPNDENEGVVVRRIMRFFKQGMAPKRFNTDLIFVGSPNVFRLRYSTDQDKRIKGLNMFKICALTTCQTNFTPEGVYQAYDDPKAGSMPVRSTMTLGFTELTPIFESDYLPELEGADTSTQDLFNVAGDGSFESIEPDDVAF